MKKFLLVFISVALHFNSFAQNSYLASTIPKALLPYASAVIRNKETVVEVKALDNTLYRVKECITVLNKNGDNLAQVVVWHNKSNIIKFIKGAVYNEFGNIIGKFNESSFNDVNAASNASLFEDSRVKYFKPVVTNYPYTVEYEYEVRSEQTIRFPDWKPLDNTGLAVEKSSFKFISKPDFNIRYKQINLATSPVINLADKKTKIYTWEVDNLPALKDEEYSPNPDSYVSCVKIAPEKFEYEGIAGSFSNWNELGKWVYDKLLLNRDILPQSTITEIRTLTQSTANQKDKARKVYEYLQNKTHYISIQIGIGGYQPFLASEVDRLGYGDCKGLVNYMQALLKAIDIESYYCVVESGSNKTSMIADFASMDQGNHIILCIPFKNDTTWLECTNQKLPFGYLGSFTGNRTVLACTAQGGKLLKTPQYTAKNSLQSRLATFNIDDEGQLFGNMETKFKGAQYENRESMLQESPIEQSKALKHIYPINNLDLEKFSFNQNKGDDPLTTETIVLKARDYAAVEQNSIRFMLNPVNRINRIPHELKHRLSPVFINNGFTDIDTITFKVPQNYKLEKSPLAVNIEKPFGNYQASMTLTGNILLYKRRLSLLEGTYDKDTYQQLIDFYKKVADADNFDVVLNKKQ